MGFGRHQARRSSQSASHLPVAAALEAGVQHRQHQSRGPGVHHLNERLTRLLCALPDIWRLRMPPTS